MQSAARAFQLRGLAMRTQRLLAGPSTAGRCTAATAVNAQLQLRRNTSTHATAAEAQQQQQQQQVGSDAQATTSGKPMEGGPRPSWDIRMLYDGDCPLCMKEVNFLRGRDAGKNKVDFVDIASPSYRAEDNAGLSYEEAMARIHAITADGQVITGVEVFRRLYEAVGLGWVYAITRYEPIGRAAEALYNVWAKYRMEVTGREALPILLAKRRAAQEGGDATLMCKPSAEEGTSGSKP